MVQHWLQGRCTHVSNKPCLRQSTDNWEDATPRTNSRPCQCHSTDYWEDATPGTNNKRQIKNDWEENLLRIWCLHADSFLWHWLLKGNKVTRSKWNVSCLQRFLVINVHLCTLVELESANNWTILCSRS